MSTKIALDSGHSELHSLHSELHPIDSELHYMAKNGTLARQPWIETPQDNLQALSDTISTIVENPQPRWWWPIFLMVFTIMIVGFFSAVYLIATGVGVWGSNNPVNWAFDITNFVFWIGIGHAGTLISAILFLFRQKWRTSINRFAEAMTIFAVICAGIYPGIHVGRFWYAWFMFPVPNANYIWQNFRSALCWDLFAVGTYFTISLLFWYTGLIPDLATLRDRSQSKYRKLIFSFLSLGWRGSAQHWRHYEIAYLLLAGFSTPLVLSVHSVVSFDFSTSVLAGWHTTIFPPYFVAGAIFGGFAMVLQCMIPVRMMYAGIKNIVTIQHLDVMAKFILGTGTLVGYAYAMEFFIAWYSGSEVELQTFINRATGSYWWAYWIMVSCNLFIPQILWLKSWRRTPWKLLIVATFVNIGMWFERFVIIVQSLHRDELPASWGNFYPSIVDWTQMIGVFGLFFTLTLLFIRFLPMIAIAEVKGILPTSQPHHDDSHIQLETPRTQNTSNENISPQKQTTAENLHSQEHPSLQGSSEPVEAGHDDLIETHPDSTGKPYALVAQFKDAASIKHGAQQLSDSGYKTLDAYTPYPVHGLVKALGKKRSYMPWITITGSVFGLSTAIFLQYYLSAVYYPLITQGKQYTSWEAFIPICFELIVLFSGIFTFLGLILVCKLPRLYHPLDQYRLLKEATNRGFFLTIQANDFVGKESELKEKLGTLGAFNMSIVTE